ncbi:MAG: HAD family phosphatase [Erysipelotrichaceae bacterium]|nr:HAD family phosphatase [Erysipelotrichaceae bacterium]
MIKVLFSDFDGTLILHLPERSYIPEENIEAVYRFRDSGRHFVMTTGRAIPEFLPLAEGFDKGGDFIGANGSVIQFDDGTEEIMFLDSELVADLLTRLSETLPEILFFYFIDDEERIGYDNLKGDKERSELEEVIETIRKHQGHINIASVETSSHEELPLIEEMLEREFSGRITISIPTPRIVDFTAKGVNKGKAIEKFCKHYGITKEETAGIGDGRNDSAIFEAVNYKFAMNSGHPQLKEKADYLVDSVAEAIEMIEEMNRQ